MALTETFTFYRGENSISKSKILEELVTSWRKLERSVLSLGHLQKTIEFRKSDRRVK